MMKLPVTSYPHRGLLNHLNSFHRGMFKLNAKFDADSLLYLLSLFESYGHTVHMLTPWCATPTDKDSVIVIVHACTFQSTLLGCQVISMLRKLFSLQ